MIFRDGDFWIGKGPREFFSRVPLKGLRLKMGSMVVLPFSHLVFICVHTNRANLMRDCRLINQIPKSYRVLTSRDKLSRFCFVLYFHKENWHLKRVKDLF